MMNALLMLLSSLEDCGGLKAVKSADGEVPQAKLVLDKQTYDAVTRNLAGLLRVESETKQVGLCFTVECGDVN